MTDSTRERDRERERERESERERDIYIYVYMRTCRCVYQRAQEWGQLAFILPYYPADKHGGPKNHPILGESPSAFESYIFRGGSPPLFCKFCRRRLTLHSNLFEAFGWIESEFDWSPHQVGAPLPLRLRQAASAHRKAEVFLPVGGQRSALAVRGGGAE